MTIIYPVHEHAALLQFPDPPENEVTDSMVHADVDDISDISDIASESGPISCRYQCLILLILEWPKVLTII